MATDVRVLIPRVRRSLEGPQASASGVIDGGLEDGQIEAMVADAVADVILYSGGFFGHTLEVVERDDTYQAPTKWEISGDLSEQEGSVIVAQAAINYIFHQLRDLKTQETIRNEAREWSWSKSATVLKDYLKMLTEARDRALEVLSASGRGTLDTYISFLAVRDQAVAVQIEPWTQAGGAGGQEMARAGWLTG